MGIRATALMRGVRAGVLAGATWACLGVHTANAAGVEDSVTGAVALGRSANFVRANDMMAVWQNPANLALVPRRDLALDLRLSIFDACFERQRDPAVTYLATEPNPFPEVCNDAALMPAGNFGFAMPLPKGFGFGVGMFTPGGISRLRFGSSAVNTLSTGAEVDPTTGVTETPGRFMMVEREILAGYLMAGVGYQPNRFVRMGLSVGAGFFDVKFANVTSLLGGTFTEPQIGTKLSALDAFVPRATLSVAATPIDSVDLMASFTWNDDLEATGHLDVTANGFDRAPRKSCADAAPGPNCRAEDVTLKVPYQRYEVVLGARYAQRRVARARALDPMKDEIWDVEVDGYWSQTSRVDAYQLTIHDGTPPARIELSTQPGTPAALPTSSRLFHGWQDTYGLRLGGDYNVLPSRLAVRLGTAWESRGVPMKNTQIDHWPVSRVTLSLGATAQFGRWKVSAAYARVFNESVKVPVGQGNIKEIVAANPQQAQAVNEGTYRSSNNVLSLQGNVIF